MKRGVVRPQGFRRSPASTIVVSRVDSIQARRNGLIPGFGQPLPISEAKFSRLTPQLMHASSSMVPFKMSGVRSWFSLKTDGQAGNAIVIALFRFFGDCLFGKQVTWPEDCPIIFLFNRLTHRDRCGALPQRSLSGSSLQQGSDPGSDPRFLPPTVYRSSEQTGLPDFWTPSIPRTSKCVTPRQAFRVRS